MERQVEQKIRERAYEIWLEAGRMHGRELEHWTKAERDVAVTRKPVTVGAGATATKPAKAAKAKTTKAADARTVATKPEAGKAKVAKTKSAPSKSVKAKTDAVKSPTRAKPAAEVRGTLN